MATRLSLGWEARGRSRTKTLGAVAVGASGVAACITILFLSMREVLELGGFVASGGPYEIAHPAPDWIWTVPASIVVGFVFGGLYVASSLLLGRFSSLTWIWSSLFLALGWNFLEYGFRPPEGMGSAWGWIVCGVVFVAMGAGPLVASRLFSLTAQQMFAGAIPDDGDQAIRSRYRAVHVVAIPAGVLAGYFFFDWVTG